MPHIICAKRKQIPTRFLTVLISRESDLDTKPMSRLKIGLVLTGCADWIKFIRIRLFHFREKIFMQSQHDRTSIWFVFESARSILFNSVLPIVLTGMLHTCFFTDEIHVAIMTRLNMIGFGVLLGSHLLDGDLKCPSLELKIQVF